jgi:hypothetical protein
MKADVTPEQVLRLKAARDAVEKASMTYRKAKATEDQVKQDLAAVSGELTTLCGSFLPDDEIATARWLTLKTRREILANYLSEAAATVRVTSKDSALINTIKMLVEPLLAVLDPTEKIGVLDSSGFSVAWFYGSWLRSSSLALDPASCAAMALADVDRILAVRVTSKRFRDTTAPGYSGGQVVEETVTSESVARWWAGSVNGTAEPATSESVLRSAP